MVEKFWLRVDVLHCAGAVHVKRTDSGIGVLAVCL